MPTTLDIAFAEQQISIRKSDDVDVTFAIKTAAGVNVNLTTGYTAKLQARVNPDDASPVISLDNTAGLVLGNGTIVASFANADTAAYDFETATFELEITQTDGGGAGVDLVKTARRGTVTTTDSLIGDTAVTSVTLDEETLALVVGGATGTLVATVLPIDATDPTVTWASDDEAVATVADGVVTAVGAGTCTITATAGTQTDTCAVTVTV